jgi:glycosyltransferase involved in cell wall biosynthesis
VPTVLHIVDGVGTGGIVRAVVAVSEASTGCGGPEHLIVSLRPPSEAGLALAGAAGLRVVPPPKSDGDLCKLVDAADVVQVEYCNHPLIVRLARMALPPCRLLAWFHVAGHAPPHVIPSWWVSFLDLAVTTSEFSARLPATAGRCELVHAPADPRRVATVRPVPHDGVHVGFVGTADFTKLHDRYVAMHLAAAEAVPDLTCHAWGTRGDDVRVPAWAADRFVFGGAIDDIAPALSLLDIYGYPLRPGTYASSELNLQEAMWAGLPTVVFPYGGVGGLVVHGETGLVVDSVRAYAAAVARLASNPVERAEMSAAGRQRAEALFSVDAAARRMNDIYDGLLRAPKRKRPAALPSQPALPEGSSLFVDSWGEFGALFPTALEGRPDVAREAAVAALAAEPIFTVDGHGSPFHYRRFFPGDPFLSYWCDLLTRRC